MNSTNSINPINSNNPMKPGNSTNSLTYVLITPARNEAAFIDGTIESVISQTVLPLKWVIVSDGSTDGTDEIVKSYTARYLWMELVRMPEREERHFAGKVYAFNAGYERVKDLEYEIVGSLDADLTFDEHYFSFLLDKFIANPLLGVGGTPFTEEGKSYDYRFSSTEHVSGACQLFRRECFEDIGGYSPLKAGGIDLAAVLKARMRGWQTRSFTEKTTVHHKKTQTGGHSSLKATFKSGYHDYLMGSHPLWQIFRAVYQMTKKPFIGGGLALLTGYFWALLARSDRIVPQDVVIFRRREQVGRLRVFLKRSLSPKFLARSS